MVEIHKSSYLHKELSFVQGFRYGFSLVLANSCAFEPVDSDSCARALSKDICRADRDIL